MGAGPSPANEYVSPGEDTLSRRTGPPDDALK